MCFHFLLAGAACIDLILYSTRHLIDGFQPISAMVRPCIFILPVSIHSL